MSNSIDDIINEVLRLNANAPVVRLDFSRIDILIDEFERNGKFVNHEFLDAVLKMATSAPKLARALKVATEALRTIAVIIVDRQYSQNRAADTLVLIEKILVEENEKSNKVTK